jgi:hypothetical protein
MTTEPCYERSAGLEVGICWPEGQRYKSDEDNPSAMRPHIGSYA